MWLEKLFLLLTQFIPQTEATLLIHWIIWDLMSLFSAFCSIWHSCCAVSNQHVEHGRLLCPRLNRQTGKETDFYEDKKHILVNDPFVTLLFLVSGLFLFYFRGLLEIAGWQDYATFLFFLFFLLDFHPFYRQVTLKAKETNRLCFYFLWTKYICL